MNSTPSRWPVSCCRHQARASLPTTWPGTRLGEPPVKQARTSMTAGTCCRSSSACAVRALVHRDHRRHAPWGSVDGAGISRLRSGKSTTSARTDACFTQGLRHRLPLGRFPFRSERNGVPVQAFRDDLCPVPAAAAEKAQVGLDASLRPPGRGLRAPRLSASTPPPRRRHTACTAGGFA